MAGKTVAALPHLQGFILSCGVDHLGVVRDDWLEGKVFVLIPLLGLFVLFSLLHLVLSKPINNISLELVLFCNYIVDLFAGAIYQRFISKILRLFFISLYLLLIESVGL